MSIPGKEVYRCYDHWGRISVFELSPYRYLAFGEGGEQSCMLIGASGRLVHQYAQAMMLSLVLVDTPKRALVLGVGAGSLVNALLAQSDGLEVCAVELRDQVISVARQWFDFQDHERLQLVVADAGDFLRADGERFDLIMADLYDDTGIVDLQRQLVFFERCYARLSDQAVLVLNLWADDGGLGQPVLRRVTACFDACWLCPVEEGNVVVFAFRGRPPPLSPLRLLTSAKQRGRQLGYPLHKLLRRLRPA